MHRAPRAENFTEVKIDLVLDLLMTGQKDNIFEWLIVVLQKRL